VFFLLQSFSPLPFFLDVREKKAAGIRGECKRTHTHADNSVEGVSFKRLTSNVRFLFP